MRPLAAALLVSSVLSATQSSPAPGSDVALLSVGPAPNSPAGTRRLDPPAAARAMGGGLSGGSMDSFTSDVRLETTTSVEDVASHYASQIRPPEWQRESASGAAGLLSVTRFSGRTADGTSVTAMLVVTKVGGNSVDVALRLLRGRGTAFAPAGPPPPPPPPPPMYGRPGGAGASANITGIESIPPAVVNLLLGGSGPSATERTTIQADVPSTFPKDLLPAGARVIAAAVSETQTTALALAPALSIAELQKFAAGLTRSGWRTTGFTTFVNASLTPLSIRACREMSSARTEFLSRQDGGFHVRVTVMSSRETCRQRYPEFAGIAMPLLVMPVNAGMPSWAERTSAAPAFEASGSLRTVVVPSVLATDLAGQMAAEGWQPGGTAGQPNSFSAARFTADGSSATPVTSFFLLTTIPGRTMVDAWVRVLR